MLKQYIISEFEDCLVGTGGWKVWVIIERIFIAKISTDFLKCVLALFKTAAFCS